jgi:hypothetical protein
MLAGLYCLDVTRNMSVFHLMLLCFLIMTILLGEGEREDKKNDMTRR